MKRTTAILLCAVAGTLWSAAPELYATTVGLNTDPMGSAWDRNDIGTGFAIWDTFPAGATSPMGFPFPSITADSPDFSFGISSLSSTATFVSSGGAQGGGVTGSGDRVYLAGSPSQWNLTGTTSFDVNGAILQIKQYQWTSESLNDLYSPTLNGLAFDNFTVSLVGEGANTQRIMTWYWNSSLTGTVTSLDFSFGTDVGSHSSIDAIAIDVGPTAVVPVPEPTAIALLGGTGMLVLLRRRRPLIAG